MAPTAYSQKARAGISSHVKKHRKAGTPRAQSVAAALSEQRRRGRKVPSRKAKGGAKKQGAGARKRSTTKKGKAVRKGRTAKARKSR